MADPDKIETGSTEPELPPTEIAAAATPEASPAELSSPSARDIALKSAGGLIAGTFDALVIEDTGSDDAAPSETEVTAVAEVESTAPEASGASEVEATPPLALAKRTVTSVPVGADGQPEWPMTARSEPEAESAAAGAARDVASADSPEIEPLAFAPLTEAAAPRPVARPETLGPKVDTVPAGQVRVGDSAVNVRSGPSGSNTRIFVLAAGTDVRATHALKGWVQIEDDKGREGWVYSDYLVNVDLESLPAPAAEDVQVASAAQEPATASDIRTVLGQGVNVRSGPSSSRGKLFALRGGVKVTVTGEDHGWLKITDPDGRTGWAYQQFLSGG